MNALIDWAVGRSRTTLSILGLVLISGLYSYLVIPVEAEPNIQVPVFVVTIPHEGISPEDSERLLVAPMEIELQSVEGLQEMTAYAAEGSATLVTEFEADFDSSQALLDVREAVDRGKARLPSSAEEPIISEVSTSDYSIVTINFTGDVPNRTLQSLAERVQKELETIPEVLEANLRGSSEEVLEIIIDPARLETYQIDPADLLQNISLNNRLVPAGALDSADGRFSIKVPGTIETAPDLLQIPLKTDGDTVITVADLTEVRRTFKARNNHARADGMAAISIEVSKRVNANLISTVEQVRKRVEAMRGSFPTGVRVFFSQDQSPDAQRQVDELTGNIVTALALVMIIVVAALGLRSGLLVGLAIPTSFLASIILLNGIGYSFNFMVMFGMLLGLGMLIDGAIVVTEYADRKMAEGVHRRQAFALAAKRMFWPVTASTCTTLAAFLPLIFWPGVSGKFMLYLPVTVFCVLVGSLAYALFFGPTIGALVGKTGAQNEREMQFLKTLENGDPRTLPGFTGMYARLIDLVTRWPGTVMLLTVSILVCSIAGYLKMGGGMVFFNNTDPVFARVIVKARGNLSVQERLDLTLEAEKEVVRIPGIKSIITWTSSGSSIRRNSDPDRIGTIFLEMHEKSQRTRSGREILEEIRRNTRHIAGINVEVSGLEQGPPVGKPVQLEFSARSSTLLESAVTRVREYIDTVEGLRDISDTRSLPGVEWELQVDRAQAAIYGASVSDVGTVVQMVTNGVKVADYRPDNADDAVDIRARFPEQYRNLSMLSQLRINTPSGSVPASNFVRYGPVPNVDTIQRVDSRSVEYIRANIAPGVLADDKVKEIRAWLDTQEFDPSLEIEFRGANEEQADAVAFVQIAFALALLLMFVLLVTQFNSFYQSILILFAVVMSTAGVLLGLIITGEPFSAILTGVGVVALAGIVVNNNIVLIDTYNTLKRERADLDIREIIVRTGAQRLRPVFLTSLTTIFGMLPLSLHVSVDFISRTIAYGSRTTSFWVPLTQSIVAGLTFATILTLVSTPAMLALPQQMQRMRHAALAWCYGVLLRMLPAPADTGSADSLAMAGDHPAASTQPPQQAPGITGRLRRFLLRRTRHYESQQAATRAASAASPVEPASPSQ